MVVVIFVHLRVDALDDDLNIGLSYVVGHHWLTSPLIILVEIGHEVGSENPNGRGFGVCAHRKRLLVTQLVVVLMGVHFGGISAFL